MSALPRFASSTRLNNLATLDTSHTPKPSADLRGKRTDASPQTTRSAPGERSKYQLWPSQDQRVTKPPPEPLGPAAVPAPDQKRSFRVHHSAEQMWLVYGKGEGRRLPLSKHFSKRTHSSPKNTPPTMLDVASITSTTRSNRRSYSAPGRTHQPENLGQYEDVSMEYYETTSLPQEDLNEKGLATDDQRKSLKRASSVLLPAELNDLIFPRHQRRAFDADGKKIKTTCGQPDGKVSREESENEIPPAVPPKTPPKKPASNLRVSPLKLRPAKGPACDKALPQIGTAETPSLTAIDPPNCQGESRHVRDGSGDSVMDRGRPMKRSRSHSRKGFMGSASGSSVDLTCEILPKGWLAHSVFANLSREEIRKLENQARTQAGRFEVLHYKDVKALSQQVRLLDEQCEYLRGFAKSLRRNRRTLHAQTIAYLKSPALSEIPRQSMLQKVETLADLDDTIDDWAKKLERTEDQRLRARQRLLEHIAAVLVMPSVIETKRAASGGPSVGRDQTPPQSPEGLKSPPVTGGYDAESIRVYAGSEMHALLGVLDKETAALKSTRNVP